VCHPQCKYVDPQLRRGVIGGEGAARSVAVAQVGTATRVQSDIQKGRGLHHSENRAPALDLSLDALLNWPVMKVAAAPPLSA
jgi:hypothetical protein